MPSDLQRRGGALKASSRSSVVADVKEAISMTRSMAETVESLGAERRAAAARREADGVQMAGGFQSLGAFLRAVAEAAGPYAVVTDPRLVRAPSGANEGTPSAGGFLVPTL